MKDTYRMYGLVPYNLSPIQQGIQFGHAVVEYMLAFDGDYDLREWANECKTFIILNGGTTNTRKVSKGTLNKAKAELVSNGIKISTFYETDLGDQLTAVVFLVPEKVYTNSDLDPDLNLYDDLLLILGTKENRFLHLFLKNYKLA
jgi:hypothetical protein